MAGAGSRMVAVTLQVYRFHSSLGTRFEPRTVQKTIPKVWPPSCSTRARNRRSASSGASSLHKNSSNTSNPAPPDSNKPHGHTSSLRTWFPPGKHHPHSALLRREVSADRPGLRALPSVKRNHCGLSRGGNAGNSIGASLEARSLGHKTPAVRTMSATQ